MADESDAAFLARIKPPFLKRDDRARLAEMMAAAAREDGDEATATRLEAEAATIKAGGSLRRRTVG